MRRHAELRVAVDVGASKVAVVVGKTSADRVTLVGTGFAPLFANRPASQNDALRVGTVLDLEATADAIAKAVREAELSAGCTIYSVVASVGGTHVRGANSHGVVALEHAEVRRSDVEQVLRAARAIPIPDGRQVLHVLPQHFVLDGQEGIFDPTGMSGVRLETQVHVVTAAVAPAENVVRCFRRADLEVAELIWAPLATAEAVLAAEEKDLGVVLLDLGAGTTDVLVFQRGALRFSFAIGLGGSLITNDIAYDLRISFQEAEHVKIRSGCALLDGVAGDEKIEVPSVGTRPARLVNRRRLAWVIESRAEEIIQKAWEQVKKVDGHDFVRSGIVLAGGGALLPAMDQLVARVTGLDVRAVRSTTENQNGDESAAQDLLVEDPVFLTATGLLLFPLRNPRVPTDAPVPQRLWERVRGGWRDFVRALRE